MKTSEVLIRTANHLDTNGWHQRGGGTNGDAVDVGNCVLGGIGAVLNWEFEGDFRRAVRALIRYLGVTDGLTVARWNDAPTTFKSDVLEALIACALIEQARESVLEKVAA